MIRHLEVQKKTEKNEFLGKKPQRPHTAADNTSKYARTKARHESIMRPFDATISYQEEQNQMFVSQLY